jgi:hypothetical protein
MESISENKNLPGENLASRIFRVVKNAVKSRKTRTFLASLFLVCILALINTQIAHASVVLDFIKDTVIGNLLLGVQNLMILIVSIAATLFGSVINPANISGTGGILNAMAIKNIWIMVRDVLNMFFILILLFSAFCTIFQVEKWNLKKVWLGILINALLVNFSFPIARLFIDISNVAMYYFVNHLFASSGTTIVNGSSIMASFGSASQLSNLLTPGDFAKQPIMYELAIIIFTFIFGITLLICAILFTIRIVVLAMLIMFSPIGFIGYIFPSTSSYADNWWKQLFSYSFFGPIMIFMMSLAIQVSQAIGEGNSKNFFANASMNSDAAQANFIAKAAFFSIPIIILWIGMGVAKSMGIAGADIVVGKAQQFAQWAGRAPFRAGWFGMKAAGRKFDRDVMKSWSPRAILTAWNANAKAKEDAHLSGATGAWRDKFSKALGEGTTHYKDMEEENLKAKKLKEMESYATNDDYLLSEIRSLKGKKDAESRAKVTAAVSMMFRNNDQNEFMKKFGINGAGSERTPIATREALAKLFRETGMNENQVGRNLYQLGEIGLAKGNYGDYGMGIFDKHTNSYRVADNKQRDENTGAILKNSDGSDRIGRDEQIIASEGKFVNLGSQEKMRSIHWNAILTENKNGTTGSVHEVGKTLLNRITASETKQVNRSRADFLERMSSKEGRASLENFIKSDECTNKENVRELLKKIDEHVATKAAENTI